MMKQISVLIDKTGIITPAGFSMVVISLVVLTPWCGYMFDCGCTWPWAGLERDCNIHDPTADYQCPWCSSLLAGVVSSAISVLAALWTAISWLDKSGDRKPPIFSKTFMLAICSGLISFMVVATATGWLSGHLQDYPVFFI